MYTRRVNLQNLKLGVQPADSQQFTRFSSPIVSISAREFFRFSLQHMYYVSLLNYLDNAVERRQKVLARNPLPPPRLGIL